MPFASQFTRMLARVWLPQHSFGTIHPFATSNSHFELLLIYKSLTVLLILYYLVGTITSSSIFILLSFICPSRSLSSRMGDGAFSVIAPGVGPRYRSTSGLLPPLKNTFIFLQKKLSSLPRFFPYFVGGEPAFWGVLSPPRALYKTVLLLLRK